MTGFKNEYLDVTKELDMETKDFNDPSAGCA